MCHIYSNSRPSPEVSICYNKVFWVKINNGRKMTDYTTNWANMLSYKRRMHQKQRERGQANRADTREWNKPTSTERTRKLRQQSEVIEYSERASTTNSAQFVNINMDSKQFTLSPAESKRWTPNMNQCSNFSLHDRSGMPQPARVSCVPMYLGDYHTLWLRSTSQGKINARTELIWVQVS